ncbi:7-carboxy-7-deazaguanine synthase QueE [Streptomyces chromofuscus]|uniref:7-carboxy-7-deazaguanine synthase n=1 Tax=Streptomyces chromofuscus TaxID=42881 RepID=A0A7M2T3A1_STRCW|nr:7-carboxy-7-deazaguanine synthase QueE [Streptomyces chromofuscus]QOV43052.1 7-carboxy-7-deazaguanine synthase QueE [Streptomyces chromofuscus]GGS93394.1 7-carboxy-7-deazaguanine synthase [Streptomyces chromofuscus]
MTAMTGSSAQAGVDREFWLIVSEVFGDTKPTFQGEGPSTGVPALFIRLAQCNLTCSWCDTKYTWDWKRYDIAKETHRRSVEELIAWALAYDVELVVISGGEPLLQQRALVRLVRGLREGGKRVEFETNGTVLPDSSLLVDGVHFNVSPKLANSGVAEAKRIVPAALEAFASSGRAVFKFVTRSVAELDEIQQLVDDYGLAPVYVMPEGTTPEGLIETTRVLADAVAARRWHFTQRLHVLAFAEARGR